MSSVRLSLQKRTSAVLLRYIISETCDFMPRSADTMSCLVAQKRCVIGAFTSRRNTNNFGLENYSDAFNLEMQNTDVDWMILSFRTIIDFLCRSR
jgi:hypothetical protein